MVYESDLIASLRKRHYELVDSDRYNEMLEFSNQLYELGEKVRDTKIRDQLRDMQHYWYRELGIKTSEDLIKPFAGEAESIVPNLAQFFISTPPPTINLTQTAAVEASASWAPTPLSHSPFGDTGRITDPDRFYGRQEILDRIFEELGRGVNVALVGESGTGKSSILSMVCRLGPERLDLPSEVFIYLSLEWVYNEDDFYEALCDSMGIVPAVRGYKLSRILQGKRYILCLDEVGEMAGEDQRSTVRVLGQMRGLADGADAPLTLVTASRQPLTKIFAGIPEFTSPLANIFREVRLDVFSEKAARAFIKERLQNTDVIFTEQEITQLIEESEGHPAQLQSAAADLYRQKTSE